jgi:hypothetical protein
MNLQYSGEAHSHCGKQGKYTCEQCHRQQSNLKSLNRHMTEVHFKPPMGQVQKGWFTCVVSQFC